MIARHQLAVAPRITAGSLVDAALTLLSPRDQVAALSARLEREFIADRCVLTDSGTSALLLALRLLAGENGTVALPGYGCVDLTSAARFAGVKVILYDVEPDTLSPDLDSVAAVLRRGVDAILVAHYYGYPADVRGVRELASRCGVPVLEDAAQAAAGTLHGARLGSLGDVSVLSFGRGKGLFGGHGGALLVRSTVNGAGLAPLQPLGTRRGAGDFVAAVVQWLLGRPRVYGIPASVPWLHLGEMVYRPAHDPRRLSLVAASLVRAALANEASDSRARLHKATALHALASDMADLTPVRPIAGGESGYLRFAVHDRSRLRRPAPRLGVMRGYPLTLRQQPELAPQLVAGQPATAGADELSRSLFTLPTHFSVTHADVLALGRWMASVGARARGEHEARAVWSNEIAAEGSTQ